MNVEKIVVEKTEDGKRRVGSDIKVANLRAMEASEVKTIKIPKYRFDVINLALKDTRQELQDKTELVDKMGRQLIKLQEQLIDSKVETVLTQFGAKNIVATKVLVDYSMLSLQDDGRLVGIAEQIETIKIENRYMFDSGEGAGYVLLPIGSKLARTMLSQMEKTESQVK